MSVIQNILGTRSTSKVKVIADFDKLISEPIGFRFNGKIYEIKPVDTESFMKIANSLGQIETLLKGGAGGLKDEEVYHAYYDFISPICPTLSLRDIKSLAVPQLFALLNLIIKHLTGETVKDTTGDEEEKKNFKMRG